MADAWQTYPVEFKGGLVSNLSPLQQGTNLPGSATVLQNFEPSVEGGYRRILGFDKFDSNTLSNSGLIRGVFRFDSQVYAARGNDLFRSTGNGWTQITDSTAFPPSVATAKVNNATSSTTSLVVDNNNNTIIAGMVVTGTGISGTVTVSSLSDQNNLVLSSAQSLSNNVDLTFTEKSSTLSSDATKVRFAKYNFDGTEKFVFVDGASKPFIFNNTSLRILSNLSSDFGGCTHTTIFKNHIFFAKSDLLLFSAPYLDGDSSTSTTQTDAYSVAAGGGSINVGGTITDLIVFRDQLIIFTETSIKRLTGNTISDFRLDPITEDVGAIDTDTAQELGGDVIFLAPDGLRLLTATDRLGDFGLGVVSKKIQKETTNFINNSITYATVTIRQKSQYRIYGFNSGFSDDSAQGLLGTQYSTQGGLDIAWSELKGMNAFVSHSSYDNEDEHAYFANDDGYVYELEKTNGFDGGNIEATFNSPFLPISDPRVRKTFYKLFLYTDPAGSVDVDFSLKLDFDRQDTGLIQPAPINLSNSAGNVFLYGSSNFVHAGLVNNGSGLSIGATSAAVDTLSATSDTGITTNDTFKFAGVAQIHTLTAVPTVSGSAGSATTTLNFTPALAGTIADNTQVIFTKVAGQDEASYSDGSLESQFETQLIGSGFTAALRIDSDNTSPAFTLDAATLEYAINGRR